MDAAGKPMLAWDYNERMDATTAPRRQGASPLRDALRRAASARRAVAARSRDASTGADRGVRLHRTRFRYGEGQPDDKAQQPARSALAALRRQRPRADRCASISPASRSRATAPGAATSRRPSSIGPAASWTTCMSRPRQRCSKTRVFTQRTEYDALGRMTRHYNWHRREPSATRARATGRRLSCRVQRRGALERRDAARPRAQRPRTATTSVARRHARRRQAITRITYNAKGQKLRARARQRHDHALHLRPADVPPRAPLHAARRRVSPTTARSDTAHAPSDRRRPCGVQNLHYTYDPVGNITHIQDDAQQTIWFANQQVEPSSDYVYDALYRLIEATGRENAAAIGAPPQPEGPGRRRRSRRPPTRRAATPSATATTPSATSTRCGTSRRVRSGRAAGAGRATTRYAVGQQPARSKPGTADTLEPAARDGNVVYALRRARQHAQPQQDRRRRFDLRWDWRDMIHTLDLGGGGRACYQYGSDKQRMPQAHRAQSAVDGTIKEERIYLGGYELYRRYTGDPDDAGRGDRITSSVRGRAARAAGRRRAQGASVRDRTA